MSKKRLAAISQERKENAAKIKQLENELQTSREQWRSTSDAEKIAYIKNTDTGARIIREWDEIAAEIDRRKNLQRILIYNYKKELAATVAPILAEILKKYEGKQAGEKTREKINQELQTACGCSVYFEINYNGASDTASISELVNGYPVGDFVELYGGYNHNFINSANTIQAIDAAALVEFSGEYITNPAKLLDEIEKARADAEKAKEAYNKAAERYNKLIVDGMPQKEYIYK